MLRDRPFIAEVVADLCALRAHLLASPPHHGQAKWAASQAAEKLLKCVVQVRNNFEPKAAARQFKAVGHNIKAIASMAADAGMPMIPDGMIEHSLASANMRYGDLGVTLADAVSAQDAAFEIAFRVFRFLDPKSRHP